MLWTGMKCYGWHPSQSTASDCFKQRHTKQSQRVFCFNVLKLFYNLFYLFPHSSQIQSWIFLETNFMICFFLLLLFAPLKKGVSQKHWKFSFFRFDIKSLRKKNLLLFFTKKVEIFLFNFFSMNNILGSGINRLFETRCKIWKFWHYSHSV